MEKKYTVVSFYNYNCEKPVDFVHIYNSTEEDLRRDGENFVGSSDAFSLDCYDSLTEAISHSGYWPTAITYDEAFTKEEKEEIVKTSNTLIHNEDFIKKYPAKNKDFIKDITIDDLIFDSFEQDKDEIDLD